MIIAIDSNPGGACFRWQCLQVALKPKRANIGGAAEIGRRGPYAMNGKASNSTENESTCPEAPESPLALADRPHEGITSCGEPMGNSIVAWQEMAKILADKDIKKLLGTVVLEADSDRINPHGIEIRLGKHVLFQSHR